MLMYTRALSSPVILDANCHTSSVYFIDGNSYPLTLDKEFDFDGASKRQ